MSNEEAKQILSDFAKRLERDWQLERESKGLSSLNMGIEDSDYALSLYFYDEKYEHEMMWCSIEFLLSKHDSLGYFCVEFGIDEEHTLYSSGDGGMFKVDCSGQSFAEWIVANGDKAPRLFIDQLKDYMQKKESKIKAIDRLIRGARLLNFDRI